MKTFCKTIFLFSIFAVVGWQPTTIAQQTVGLFTNNSGNQPGYVLFAPTASDTTYLIDKCGYRIHTWGSNYHPGLACYLLNDGNLLRAGNTQNTYFNGGGQGGIIEKRDWNNNLIWSYTISDSLQCQHHDIHQLPNGNVLAIVWEKHTDSAAIANGRNPANVGTNFWSEKIIEVQPTGATGGNIVWQWRVWDHLVQHFDTTKLNYAVVPLHPELVNLNYNPGSASDWLHINGLDYNAATDEIIMSVHNFNELWIIDHSTSTAQAASHSGGIHLHGGDLIYRWGNPQAYGRGALANKKFYTLHNAQWIADSLHDGGKIMVFNNGSGRPTGSYSSVDIIQPPVDSLGNYSIVGNNAFLPDSAEWSYVASPPTSFYSNIIGGAQRIQNGNTLICNGRNGIFFEIDSAKNIVWDYVNPAVANGCLSQGDTAQNNSSFRAGFYPVNYAGFAGNVLTPGAPLELNPTPYSCNMLASVAEIKSENNFHFLNPFTDEIIFSTSQNEKNISVSLYDLTGREILSEKNICVNANEFISLSVSQNISSGIYLLKISSAKNNFVTKLFHEEN